MQDLVVEDGDVVGVRYKGTLEDGSVFDENPEGPLLEFEVGSGRVISGFDEAVRGLKVGESKTVTCEPKNAYGEYDDANIAKVPRSQMPDPPEGMELAPGLVLQLTTGQIAVVKEVGEDEVTLDGNHPLAGKQLTFSVTLKEIKDRTQVVKDKVAEMQAILKNPVMGMLAAEVTKNPNFLIEIEKKIEDAKDEDKGKVLNEILATEEWTTITAALMSNPQLQQIMQDPAAMAKMQMQMAEQEKEGGGGGTAPAGPEVPQAEFKEDK